MAMADNPCLPLRWEGTANGHYDLARELLRINSDDVLKLASLRANHHLETVWVGDARCADARRLFLECDTTGGKHNSVMSAGYGGWLMYSAASAGDARFVRELLDRHSRMVFGEGKYGLAVLLYDAERGKSSEVFRLVRDSASFPSRPERDVHGVA